MDFETINRRRITLLNREHLGGPFAFTDVQELTSIPRGERWMAYVERDPKRIVGFGETAEAAATEFVRKWEAA